ncbi:NAD(P)/FAD-dependent oxidoreductase [Kitasatospora sp. NPDC048194]|uniref:NAD(P)/FAD-dependent oxidoreductase n=1 Tax=Kitasatospora sp. NPDC048194 TaxID=3364045 RepID=UPI003712B508
MAPDYDVTVVGGGPAGTAAALALATRGRSVLLVHAPGGPPPVGEALPAAARMLLRDLGVADTVPGDGHLPCYGNRSTWGSARPASVDSIHDPYGPGWHLDRALFDHRMRQAAAAAGVDVREALVRPHACRLDGTWSLALEGRTVRCRRLVDATGRRAAIATTHGARRLVGDRLLALHLTLDPADAADRTTLVEAVPDGWWYSALLPDDRLLVAFFTDADLPAARGADRVRLRAALARTRHTAARAAGRRWPPGAAPRRAPAHVSRLDTVHGPGWIAAGDAAAAFDPLSSQGILTALYTGMRAGRAVHASLDGDTGALSRYAADVDAVVAAHLRNRHAYYGLERRWPHAEFWRRRHADAASAPFGPAPAGGFSAGAPGLGGPPPAVSGPPGA